MKRNFLYILFLCPSHITNAQDTLRNFNPQTQVPTATQYNNGIHTGYITGHNSLFDEEWAEKYYIGGANQVKGVIAYHTGSNGTYTEDCEYKVYSVGTNGLPNTELAVKAIGGSGLNIAGAPVYTAFTSPVNVSDSFFVSFNVGDYAHHSPGTKKIAIQHGPDGSRDGNDTLRYGRNVIRWHDHDHTKKVWKDFYTENSTNLRTHFAIFPVLTLKNTSVNDFAGNGSLKMFALFPNPAINKISLRIGRIRPQQLECIIIDQKGSVVKKWHEKMSANEHTLTAYLENMPAGQYIFIISDGSGNLAQSFVKQ